MLLKSIDILLILKWKKGIVHVFKVLVQFRRALLHQFLEREPSMTDVPLEQEKQEGRREQSEEEMVLPLPDHITVLSTME